MLPQIPQLIFPKRLHKKVSSTTQHAFINCADWIEWWHHCMIRKRNVNETKTWKFTSFWIPKACSDYDILITGMFLQISCSAIKVRRANPEIDGSSTSANMRSMLRGCPLSTSHAFKPSDTAVTAYAENIDCLRKDSCTGKGEIKSRKGKKRNKIHRQPKKVK